MARLLLLSSLAVLLAVALGQSFSGDATFYDPGLGACGINSRAGELVAAVSPAEYGNTPNPNNAPVCRRCINVNFQGRSVKCRVVDKCPGCRSGSVDLSPTAFQRLANPALGRIRVNWNFVNC